MNKVLVLLIATVLAIASAVGVVYAAAGQGRPRGTDISAGVEVTTAAPGSDASRYEDSPDRVAGIPPQAEAAEDPASQAPPPDPRTPLASSIPGCVCHSDDPDLVERHAGYRMNQCFGCHGDTPTGQ